MSFGGAFGGGSSLGAAQGRIVISVSEAINNIRQLSGELGQFSDRTANIGRTMSSVGTGVAAFGAATHGVLGLAVNSAANFEQALSGIEAAFYDVDKGASLSDASLKSLADTASRLGRDTSVSSTEAARAIEAMGKAGVSVEEVLGGAADAAVALAEAGGTDVVFAAETMSAAMNAFGISGDNAIVVADALAGAANSSLASVSDLALGLAQVGGVAATVGMDIYETATMMAILTDQGLSGSDAATSMKTAIVQLISPTEKAEGIMAQYGITTKDANGEFLGLEGMARQLVATFDALGISQTDQLDIISDLVGTDGLRAIQFGMQEVRDEQSGATKGWDEYARGVGEAGAAQRVAQTQMDNLKGSIERFRGSLDTLMTNIGMSLLPARRAFVDFATGIVNALTAVNPATLSAVVGFVSMAATIATVGGVALIAVGKFLQFQAMLQGFGISIAAFLTPIALVVTAITLLGLAFHTNFLGVRDVIDPVVDKVRDMAKAFRNAFGVIKGNVISRTFHGIAAALREITGPYGVGRLANLSKWFDKVGIVAKKFGDYLSGVRKNGDFLNNGLDELDGTLGKIALIVGKAMDAFQDFGRILRTGDISGAFDRLERGAKHVSDTLGAMGLDRTASAFLLLGGGIDVAQRAIGAMVSLLPSAVSGIQAFGSGLAVVIGNILSGDFGTAFDTIGSFFSTIGDAISRGASTLGQSIRVSVPVAVDWVLDRIEDIGSWITTNVPDIVGGIVNVVDEVKAYVKIGINWAIGEVDDLTEFVGRFAKGLIDTLFGGTTDATGGGAFGGMLSGLMGGGTFKPSGGEGYGVTVGLAIQWAIASAADIFQVIKNKVSELLGGGSTTTGTGLAPEEGGSGSGVIDIGSVAVAISGWTVSFLKDLGEAVTSFIQISWGFISAIGQTLGGYAVRLGAWIISFADDLGSEIVSYIQVSWGFISAMGQNLGGYALRLGAWALSMAEDLGSKVSELVSISWGFIAAIGKTLGGYVINISSWSVFDKAVVGIRDLAQLIIDGALKAAFSVAGVIINILSYQVSTLGGEADEGANSSDSIRAKVQRIVDQATDAAFFIGTIYLAYQALDLLQFMTGFQIHAPREIKRAIDTSLKARAITVVVHLIGALGTFLVSAGLVAFTALAIRDAFNDPISVPVSLSADFREVGTEFGAAVGNFVAGVLEEMDWKTVLAAVGIIILAGLLSPGGALVVAIGAAAIKYGPVLKATIGEFFAGMFEGLTDGGSMVDELGNVVNFESPLIRIADAMNKQIDDMMSDLKDSFTNPNGAFSRASAEINEAIVKSFQNMWNDVRRSIDDIFTGSSWSPIMGSGLAPEEGGAGDTLSGIQTFFDNLQDLVKEEFADGIDIGAIDVDFDLEFNPDLDAPGGWDEKIGAALKKSVGNLLNPSRMFDVQEASAAVDEMGNVIKAPPALDLANWGISVQNFRELETAITDMASAVTKAKGTVEPDAFSIMDSISKMKIGVVQDFIDLTASVLPQVATFKTEIVANFRDTVTTLTGMFTDTKVGIVQDFSDITTSVLPHVATFKIQVVQNLQDTVTTLTGLFTGTKEGIVRDFADITTSVLPQVATFKIEVVRNFTDTATSLHGLFTGTKEGIVQDFTDIATSIVAKLTEAAPLTRSAADVIVRGIADAFGLMSGAIEPYFQLFIDQSAIWFENIRVNLTNAAGLVVTQVAEKYGTMPGAVQPYIDLLRDNTNNTLLTLATTAGANAAGVTRSIANGFSTISGAVQPYMDQMSGMVTRVLNSLSGTAGQAAQGVTREIANGFSTVSGAVKPYMDQLASTVTGALGGLASTGYNAASHAGKQIGQGLVDGMSSMEGRVSNVAASLSDAASGAMRLAAEVTSPSRVTYRIGEEIGEGLALGLESQIGRVSDAADQIIDGIFQGGRWDQQKAVMAEDGSMVGESFFTGVSQSFLNWKTYMQNQGSALFQQGLDYINWTEWQAAGGQASGHLMTGFATGMGIASPSTVFAGYGLDAMSGFSVGASSGAGSLTGQFLGIGQSSGGALGSGVSGSLPGVLGTIGGFVSNAAGALRGLIAPAGTAGTQSGSGFNLGLVPQLASAVANASSRAQGIIGALRGVIGPSQSAGSDSGGGFSTNLGGGLSRALGVAAGAARDVGSSLRGAVGSASSAGSDTGSGFYNGLVAWVGRVASAARSIASSAANAISEFLQSRSPSRVTHQIGVDFSTGFVNGIMDRRDQVQAAAKSLATGATTYLGQTLDTSYRGLQYALGAFMGDDTPRQIADVARALGEAARSGRKLSTGELEAFSAQLKAFRGDDTPPTIVAVALALDKLANSSARLGGQALGRGFARGILRYDDPVLDAAKQLAQKATDGVASSIDRGTGAAVDAAGRLWAATSKVWTQVKPVDVNWLKGGMGPIKTTGNFDAIVKYFQFLPKSGMDWMNDFLGHISDFRQRGEIFRVAQAIGRDMANGVYRGIQAYAHLASQATLDMVLSAKASAEQSLGSLGATIDRAVESSDQKIARLRAAIVAGTTSFPGSRLAGDAGVLVDNFTSLFIDAGNARGIGGEWAGDFLTGLSDWIARGRGGEIYQATQAIGRAISEGTFKGVWNYRHLASDATLSMIEKALGTAKSVLGIASPSQVFAQMGKFMVRGMAIGLRDQEPELIRAARHIAEGVTNAFQVMESIQPSLILPDAASLRAMATTTGVVPGYGPAAIAGATSTTTTTHYNTFQIEAKFDDIPELIRAKTFLDDIHRELVTQ